MHPAVDRKAIEWDGITPVWRAPDCCIHAQVSNPPLSSPPPPPPRQPLIEPPPYLDYFGPPPHMIKTSCA